MVKAVLGVIGGSGVYDLPGLEDVREERITSPWGEPSRPFVSKAFSSSAVETSPTTCGTP